MGSRRRLSRPLFAVCVAAAAFTGTGCKAKPAPPPPEEKPRDHLDPGEVVEGKERAFGLPLPRLMHIQTRFERTVYLTSPLAPEALVNFVRARVKDGQINPGTSGTLMQNVSPLADPTKRLHVEVRPLRSGDGTKSEMFIRDTTPLPNEPGLTEDERWKKAGLTPSGQIADPKHLE
jgi:hypothetical protein